MEYTIENRCLWCHACLVRFEACCLYEGEADEEGREATRQDDISPLFLGHMGQRIHAVVAIATALNGNSVFDMLADPPFNLKSVKVPWWSRYFGKRMSDSLQTNHDGWDLKDCADYDMQIDQALLLNQRMHTLPFVYYFSVPCNFSKKSGGRYIPEKEMEPFFVMRSYQIGQYTGVTKGGTEIDQSWGMNDGRVSTISETSPFRAPVKQLNIDHLEPGIWNVYPVFKGDHMSLQGGLLHKRDVRSFYIDMLTMIDITLEK